MAYMMGVEPMILTFGGLRFNPLSYMYKKRLILEISVLTFKLMVTSMGFEPMNVALRGRCVNRFTNWPSI